VERHGVSLAHAPESIVFFIWNQEEVGKNGVHLDLVLWMFVIAVL
jgi:hypothetical protein